MFIKVYTTLGRVKVNEPQRGPCKLCSQPIMVYTSINIRKIKFIAYIYIYFNQNLDEKSYIIVKTEAVKHLHALLLLTANSADVQSDCREPWFILTSLTLHGSMLLLECKLHYVPMVYCRAFQ